MPACRLTNKIFTTAAAAAAAASPLRWLIDILAYLWALNARLPEGNAGNAAQQMVVTCGRGAAAVAPVWRLRGPRGRTGWKSESRLDAAGLLWVKDTADMRSH